MEFSKQQHWHGLPFPYPGVLPNPGIESSTVGIFWVSSKQGQRIQMDIKFVKNGRNIVFASGWMVRPKGKITNNTPLAD